MSNVKLFENQKIRSTWIEVEQRWYFSIIDVVAVLTDSANPRDYWYRIKQREKISGLELSTLCRQFKLQAPDGKLRETDCAHTEDLLRFMQSLPSPQD
jgi:DNA-damage-inducible protein D